MHEGYFSFVNEATLLPGFRPHFAEIDGVRTRYFLGGEGLPLTMIHGLGGAAVNFTKLAPILARRRRVLIPDLPGHGLSAPFEHAEGIATYSRHVHKVAELEGMLPGAVLGYSMGGVVALRLAVEEPEDVTALALVGAPSRAGRGFVGCPLACGGRSTPSRSIQTRSSASSKAPRSTPTSAAQAAPCSETTPVPTSTASAAQPFSSGARATGSCPSETVSSTRGGSGRRSASCPRPGISWSASSPSRARRFSKAF